MKLFGVVVSIVICVTTVYTNELITVSGKKYSGVKIHRENKRGITIFHDNGVATIPYKELPKNPHQLSKSSPQFQKKIIEIRKNHERRTRENKIRIKAEKSTRELIENLARINGLSISDLKTKAHVHLGKKEVEVQVYLSTISTFFVEKWKYNFVYTLQEGDELFFKKNAFSSEKLKTEVRKQP